MADALVSVVLEQLRLIIAQKVQKEVGLVAGVKDEVRKLESNFQAIQDVLADAEQRQLKEGSIKRWMGQLKNVSYDMDDVLDEWSTAIAKSQMKVNDEHPRKTIKKEGCFDQTVDGTRFPPGKPQNQEMEVTGGECFEALAARSFFQDFRKDEDDGRIIRCKMHDIVHDFAQFMTKNESFSVEIDGGPQSRRCPALNGEGRIIRDDEILEALEPPPNIDSLDISDYQGILQVLPSWFDKLRVVLENWGKIENLHPLGKLPLLEELDVRVMESVRKVGREFLGMEAAADDDSDIRNGEMTPSNTIIAFPRLKSLV
uniref:Uncharacterized protein n=1 Tax=Salix viminalis TaxID=40686 RepID=A0A6N2KDA0_SALVM